MIIYDQFCGHLEPSDGPLFPKPVTSQELFLTISYSILALALIIELPFMTEALNKYDENIELVDYFVIL